MQQSDFPFLKTLVAFLTTNIFLFQEQDRLIISVVSCVTIMSWRRATTCHHHTTLPLTRLLTRDRGSCPVQPGLIIGVLKSGTRTLCQMRKLTRIYTILDKHHATPKLIGTKITFYKMELGK